MRLNAKNPINNSSTFCRLKISPAKKRGMYKNRFFAQWEGLNSFKYCTGIELIVNAKIRLITEQQC